VTDKGSDMVIKFTPQGRVDMAFGRKQEASDEDTAPLKHPNPPLPARDGYFCQVTDVAWDGARDAYISDGYINSRVACLSDLLGHAGPLHHLRREPRRSRPIRVADGDVHGARSCLGPARSGRAEIREDAADVKFNVHEQSVILLSVIFWLQELFGFHVDDSRLVPVGSLGQSNATFPRPCCGA
jgi:hypothetical protein